MNDPAFITVADTGAVPPGAIHRVTAGSLVILLCNHDGHVFAVEDRCSHADEPLACGRLRNGWISCPAHGARFDLETGEPLSGPADRPIRTFAVRMEGEAIAVAVAV